MFKCVLCKTELAAESAPCPNPLCVLFNVQSAHPYRPGEVLPDPPFEFPEVSRFLPAIFRQVMEKATGDNLERETILERLTVAVVRSGFIYPKGEGPEEWAEAVVGLALALRSKLDNVAMKEAAEIEEAKAKA